MLIQHATKVISYVTHVTLAGLYATVYFLNDTVRHPILGSLKRALTTSFGSICFGSLLIALVNFIRYFLNLARMNSDNGLLSCFLFIIQCIVSCFQGIFVCFLCLLTSLCLHVYTMFFRNGSPITHLVALPFLEKLSFHQLDAHGTWSRIVVLML